LEKSSYTIIQQLYKEEYSHILATLIRILDSFDLAEEVLQDAFANALTHWKNTGVPEYPVAWIIAVSKNKAIDKIRQYKRQSDKHYFFAGSNSDCQDYDEQQLLALDKVIENDQLRLIFSCCHPSLATDAQIALTLRTVAGLSTSEIASAFLQSEQTIAQRLVRVKRKIKDAKIPYSVPEKSQLHQRLDSVLHVIYLIFNEGYAASSGNNAIRVDLCQRAITILQDLHKLIPDEFEIQALYALCILQDARRAARIDCQGNSILLEDQDRSLWHQQQIKTGITVIKDVLKKGIVTSYSLQASIAAVHCEAQEASQTDWHQIRALYEILSRVHPTPIVELNRAVAVSMTDGAKEALKIIDSLKNRYQLSNYHLLYTTRAKLLTTLKRNTEAITDYQQALTCTLNDTDKNFIAKKITKIKSQ